MPSFILSHRPSEKIHGPWKATISLISSYTSKSFIEAIYQLKLYFSNKWAPKLWI